MNKKNLFKSVILVVLVIFCFSIELPQANAAITCGSTPRCAQTSLTYGGSQYAASASIYLSAGESVYIDWQNDSPGKMQVVFYATKAGKQVGPTKYAAALGHDYDYFKITESGYYYLTAACEGGNDTRCQGGGTIRYW